MKLLNLKPLLIVTLALTFAVAGCVTNGQDFPTNVLGISDEPLASCDFNHDPRSAIVDLNQTRVAPNNLVKLLVWFDNEWAYANRMLDVARLLSQLN